ncbi:MAG: adenine phosphoribosyltransferase [Parcubacteria group bacterium]|nr:adenine phosphoribosyltransferase [Parcubacteria group bacterium]
MSPKHEHLKKKIREIKNYPTAGISFKDITPLLEDKQSFREAVEGIANFFKEKQVDKIVGIESRGFLFASSVAYLLNTGVVMVRKKDKLPSQKILREHSLEYGNGSLEMHTDSVVPGEKIVVIDDVLATGGTAEAAIKLTEQLGGQIVGTGFLIELPLGGREKLKQYSIYSLIQY